MLSASRLTRDLSICVATYSAAFCTEGCCSIIHGNTLEKASSGAIRSVRRRIIFSQDTIARKENY